MGTTASHTERGRANPNPCPHRRCRKPNRQVTGEQRGPSRRDCFSLPRVGAERLPWIIVHAPIARKNSRSCCFLHQGAPAVHARAGAARGGRLVRGSMCFGARISHRPTGSNDLLMQRLSDPYHRRSADTSGAAPDATLARGDVQLPHELLKSEALQASETNRVRLSKRGPDALHRKYRRPR